MKSVFLALTLTMLLCPGLPAAEPAGKSGRPEVLVQTLENGMTVILAERHAAPVCAIQVWVRCGSISEEKLLGSGVSHYVEHMLFKGTSKRGVRQMDQEIRSAGGRHNAYTTNNRTVYHATLPSRGFDVALDCLSDSIMNAAFDPEECKREKEVIVKEINRSQDNPGRAYYKHLQSLLYHHNPHKHPTIGYRHIFKALTRDDLVGYYKRHYVPNNMFFVAVGDFDRQEALEKVRKAFKDFTRKKYDPPDITPEPINASPRYKTVRDHHFKTARLTVMWPTVSISSPEMYPLDMAASILGGGRTSRLHRRLVEQEKLALSVSASNYTPTYRGRFSISARCEEKDVARVLEIIDEEVARLKNGKIKRQELHRVRERMRASSVFRRETVDGLAAELGGNFFTTGDVHFADHYRSEMNKVRAQDPGKALTKYLVPDRRMQLIGLPKKKQKDVSKKSGAQDQGAQPAATDLVRYQLPGGAKLLVMPRSVDPIVSISAVFHGGLRYENPKRGGVSRMMAKLLTKGTRRYSSGKIATILAESGGSLGGYSGRNSFGVSGKFLSSDLDLALELTAEVLTNPLFPVEEVENRKRRTLAALRQRKTDIWAENQKLLSGMLYASHPYSRHTSGTVETVKNLSRADVVDFYSRYCRPGNMVLCVAGDVNPEVVHQRVSRYFRKFLEQSPSSFEAPDIAPATRLKGARRKVVENPEFKQAMIVLAFRGVDMKNPDRYALDGLRAVLSGKGARLFTELRDRQSLAYSVGCYQERGVGAGSFIFYIATKPSEVDKSLKAFWGEIEKIKSKPVSSGELESAKNAILGGYIRSKQTVKSICQGLAYLELYGMKAESYFTEHKVYEKLSEQDILKVARSYLDRNNYVVAITMPPGAVKKVDKETNE